MPDETQYIKVKEASAFLGVCPNTLRTWGSQGKVPEFRHPINRFRLYRRSDLEAVLAGIEGPPATRLSQGDPTAEASGRDR